MNEARGQLLCGITLHTEIERSTSSAPAQNTDIKGSPLHSQISLCPSHPALCVFLECVWLYVKSFALIGSCSYVQLPRLHFHVTSDAMWRARTDGSQQLRNTQQQQTLSSREHPCLHVQIDELDSWVKSVQHRLLMISNNFCSSAWGQVWGTAGAALTSASR